MDPLLILVFLIVVALAFDFLNGMHDAKLKIGGDLHDAAEDCPRAADLEQQRLTGPAGRRGRHLPAAAGRDGCL